MRGGGRGRDYEQQPHGGAIDRRPGNAAQRPQRPTYAAHLRCPLTLPGAPLHLGGQRIAQRVQLSGALVRQELVQWRVQQADGHCRGMGCGGVRWGGGEVGGSSVIFQRRADVHRERTQGAHTGSPGPSLLVYSC